MLGLEVSVSKWGGTLNTLFGPFMLLTSTAAKIMYTNIVPDTSECRLYQ